MNNKKQVSNTTANAVTLAGVTGMLVIAGLSLPVSLAIIGATTVGCGYLTVKHNENTKGE